MGSQLAKDAFKAGLAGEISDRARIVLTHMCWMARDHATDEDPAAEYWGGHIAIGMDLLGLEKGGTPSGQEMVRRAVKELIDAKLIERVKDGSGGKRARYRITIGGRWAPAKAVDNSGMEPLI